MTTPDQPSTLPPGTVDIPVTTPPGTAVPSPEMPSAKIDYSLPQKIEFIPGMRVRYKFFQLAMLNAKEEEKFNQEFADQGWHVAGMATHGARVVILGMKLVPIKDVVDALEEMEETSPGVLDDEIDVKEAPEDSVRKPSKVVDPFAKARLGTE